MESKKRKTEPQISVIERIGRRLSSIIDVHDRMQERRDDVRHDVYMSIAEEYHKRVLRTRRNARTTMISMLGLTLVICGMLLIFDHNTLFQYSYNGRILGYVDNQENVYNMLDIAGKKLSEANGTDIKFEADQNITFKVVSRAGKDIDNADQVLNKLTYMTDIEITAYGIFADGNLSAVVRSDSTAKYILNSVIQNYRNPDDGMEIVDIGFANDIQIKPVELMLTSVLSPGQADDMLINGGKMKIQHIVGEDEDINSLRKIFNIDGDIYEGNNSNPATQVSSGDKVTFYSDVKPLIVDVVEKGTKSEKVKFSVQKVKSKDLYIGDMEVKQEGVDGKQTVTGTIYKQNGVEVARDIKKSEIIKKPVNKIINVGCTQRPKTAPTGTFVMPIHTYTITSFYGSRWGRIHGGIDFAAPTGTPIYASDGGKVIRAGEYGAYGLCVDVEHKNGTFTRYGHCSQLLVTAGQEVYQGQEIAKVGSTGRSTGSHLHFEICPNGGPHVDPQPYLPIGQQKYDTSMY